MALTLRSAVGVDGCPYGWVAAVWRRERLTFALYRNLTELWAEHSHAARICIDIPIGLPDHEGTRECDRLARAQLGSRRASVFDPPCRAALDAPDHPTANATHRAHTGRGLSVQAFNLLPRIRQTDTLLRRHPRARAAVFECHPELAFHHLADEPPLERKSTHAGQSQRRALLTPLLPGLAPALDSALATHPRRDVKPDDLLDAAACLAVSLAPDPEFRVTPAKPQTDREGLPMRLVHRAPPGTLGVPHGA